MGEVQKQRYVCKICSKSCVSGNSLGGHMRVHLALISASKKAAKAEDEIKMDFEGDDDDDDRDSYQLKDGSKIRPDFLNGEDIKNCCNNNTDSEDSDQYSNYELRENPMKSWKISDPEPGLNLGASCKECGKVFPTSKALSGHLRSHSTKNKKKNHKCKECGKGFTSLRAMFGHMKCHSKRLLQLPVDESDARLPDLENSCRPVRKKRSAIRYNSCSNRSLSVFELGDEKEVAEILIMLSRGVMNCSKFDSVVESSDDYDGSLYFRAGKSKNYIVSDKDKNVSEFDGLGSWFVAKDETKVDFDVSDEFNFMFGSTNEPEKLNEFVVKLDCASKEAISNLVKSNRVTSSVQECGSEGACENDTNLEISKSFKYKNYDKTKEHECPTCLKVFSSGQALGGHKRAHYSTGFTNEGTNREVIIPGSNQEAVVEIDNGRFDLNIPTAVEEGFVEMDVGLSLWWAEMSHEHEALVLTN